MLRAALMLYSAYLLEELKFNKRYPPYRNRFLFPFLDLFCVHLQGVPGSRGLPGADGRAGVMVRLLPESLFLNHLFIYRHMMLFATSA